MNAIESLIVVLAIIVGIVLFAIPIWTIILQVQINHLKKRISSEQHENSSSFLQTQDSEPPASNKKESDLEIPPAPVKVLPPVTRVLNESHGKTLDWESFFGRKILPIIGSISVIIGIIFFSVIAFNNSWIGPKSHVLIGLMASFLFLIIGDFMRTKFTKFFPIVSSVGIAGLLGVTFVAGSIYDFLSPLQSSVTLFLEVAFGVFLAWRYNSMYFASAVMVGGLVAPLLIANPDPNGISLLLYLSILSLAGFTLSILRQWFVPIVILLCGVVFFEFQLIFSQLFDSQPFILMSFIALMHILLGSGGLLRVIRGGMPKETNQKKIIIDMLLFIVSFIIGNIVAAVAWTNLIGGHFGFIILAQGLILYFLGEWFRSRGAQTFYHINIVGVLVTMVVATLWEVGFEYKLYLFMTFLLLLESIGGSIAYAYIRKGIFSQFSFIAAFIAFICLFSNFDTTSGANFLFWTLLGLMTIFALIFPAYIQRKHKLSYFGSRTFEVIGFLGAVITLFSWSFTVAPANIRNLQDATFAFKNFAKFLAVLPIFAASHGLGISYCKTKTTLFSYLALFLTIFTILLAGLTLNITIIFSLVYVGLWLTQLYWIFYPLPVKWPITSSQTWITITTLVGSSLFFAVASINELVDPWTTIVIFLWGGALLAFGGRNKWLHFRLVGMAVILFLLGKIYLYDIWDLVSWIRVTIFSVTGILLLIISFFYYFYANKK